MNKNNRIEKDYKYLTEDLRHNQVSYYDTIERNGFIYNIFTEKYGDNKIMINVVTTKKVPLYKNNKLEYEEIHETICTGIENTKPTIEEIDKLITSLNNYILYNKL